MSTKSSRSTTSTKNSFGILSILEDSQDLKTPKKSSAQKTVDSAAKPTIPAVQTTKPAATASTTLNNSTNNGGNNGKKDKKAKQINKEAAPKILVNGASISSKAVKPSSSVQSGNNSLFKMLIFAVLMVILPLAAYYWSVKQTGFDLGEIKSALIAVLVVNILLFIYIIMAMFESSKEDKKKD